MTDLERPQESTGGCEKAQIDYAHFLSAVDRLGPGDWMGDPVLSSWEYTVGCGSAIA